MAAARALLRRISGSTFRPNFPPVPTITLAGSFFPFLIGISRSVCIKSLHPGIIESETCSRNSTPNLSSKEALNPAESAPSTKHKILSELKRSSRHDLMMIFTCKVCETRSVKTTCRQSYENGIVVARCDGCNNLHLIADRLGWFGEPGSVEDLLAAQGQEVKKGTTDTLNFTLEDLVGRGS